ncbi:transposase [Streptosporangium saharense]|uniref:transposase n=1 Tax=Streptosporangium saharense TaxID=1706840 RepID=UPI00342D17F4
MLSAWHAERCGQGPDIGCPPEHDLRAIMNAILYVEVIRRDPTTRRFTALPQCWVVERTLGQLTFHRRLARDHEALPARSEAMIHIAMINLMSRRLTGESTPTW